MLLNFIKSFTLVGQTELNILLQRSCTHCSVHDRTKVGFCVKGRIRGVKKSLSLIFSVTPMHNADGAFERFTHFTLGLP